MFQTIVQLNVLNILGVSGGLSRKQSVDKGVTREVPARQREESSPADELHDLQVIAIAQDGFGPLLTGDNAAIQFNRNPIGFHAQLLEQSGERK
jgi:hypothetical protein